VVCIYILKEKNGRVYVGSTNDLERRLKEHKAGKSFTTKKFDDFWLEAYVAVRRKSTAIDLEKYLKSGSGKVTLKRRLIS
jgi:putative endonuclease